MKSIPSLWILADDITGAADCAARCKQAGLSATIFVESPCGALPDGAVSLSSDSRYLPPEAAATAVHRLFVALSQRETAHASTIWYKKIDSTLRGNIGAELAALLSAARESVTTPSLPVKSHPCAIVSPAFPAQGRGLVDGYLVYEQASAQTHHLPTLIQQQTALPQALIGLTVVRAGVAQLAATLTAHYTEGAQIFIADAVTEADLTTIYAATRMALPHALYCGSAGLIGVIATALVTEQEDVASSSLTAPLSIAHPMLAVVGSGSVMAHRQLAQLRRQTGVESYEVDPQSAAVNVPTAQDKRGDLALHLPQPSATAYLEGDTARRYAAVLAAAAYAQIQQRHPRTLLLVGGDTALHLLQLLGIQALTVQAEVLPGMPLTSGEAADGQHFQILLKAGNHGDEQTLVTLFSL